MNSPDEGFRGFRSRRFPTGTALGTVFAVKKCGRHRPFSSPHLCPSDALPQPMSRICGYLAGSPETLLTKSHVRQGRLKSIWSRDY
jgi:hypothetical protein